MGWRSSSSSRSKIIIEKKFLKNGIYTKTSYAKKLQFRERGRREDCQVCVVVGGEGSEGGGETVLFFPAFLSKEAHPPLPSHFSGRLWRCKHFPPLFSPP